ncbi:hypothetical protein RRG08_033084 [Elysia crispata]|uniref:Reverse transcriptase RNase H-like domain-containing protein n=1 Tax=Elysia crispata TaxID=231223 RepID=A0AAE1DUW4_9GAST|nr:hypothetical protein RRG08_033084 [Elysia crispata]
MQTSQTKKPTVVEADSSSYGLGGCLLQEYEEGLRPVAFCSRSLSNTEQRYAQIEKECLDSVWACERFDRYLMGLDSFTLYSDRKPLIPLINSQDLSETPLRCQRMLIRLLRYKPVAIHQPGKMMVTSDTLSRSPAACSQETSNLHVDVRFHVSMTLSPRPVNHNLIRNRDMANKTLQKKYFDRKTCHLPDLEPDDQVLLKKGEGEKGWNQPGEVVGQCAPRSYTISTPDGQLRRNRKNLMLQKTPHKNHPEGGLQTAPVPQEPAPPIPWPVQSPRQIPVIRPASPVEPSHQPEPSSSSPVSAKMPAENQLNHIVPDLVGLSLSLSDISDCVNLLVVKTWGRLPMQRLGCVFLSSRIESSQEMCNSYARG